MKSGSPFLSSFGTCFQFSWKLHYCWSLPSQFSPWCRIFWIARYCGWGVQWKQTGEAELHWRPSDDLNKLLCHYLQLRKLFRRLLNATVKGRLQTPRKNGCTADGAPCIQYLVRNIDISALMTLGRLHFYLHVRHKLGTTDRIKEVFVRCVMYECFKVHNAPNENLSRATIVPILCCVNMRIIGQ